MPSLIDEGDKFGRVNVHDLFERMWLAEMRTVGRRLTEHETMMF
jgi:hypothetical protein